MILRVDWLSPHDRQNRSDSGMGPLHERHGLIATVTACCVSTIGSIAPPEGLVEQSRCQGYLGAYFRLFERSRRSLQLGRCSKNLTNPVFGATFQTHPGR